MRRLRVRTRLKAGVRSTPLRHIERAYLRRRDLRRLRASPLFDAGWYAAQAGCEANLTATTRHYLAIGHSQGLSPHPLFDPEFFVRGKSGVSSGRPPFLAYLAVAGSPAASPHPLFDAGGYATAHPQATRYPHGLLAHYVRVGAARGARPNAWYKPKVASEPRGLVDWIAARHREWEQRQEPMGPQAPSAISEAVDAGTPGRDDQDESRAPTFGEPRITVVLPVGADLSMLAAMIRSVVAQTLPAWELLVVHQHDADEIAALVGADGCDSRVHLVRQHAPGLARALNDGIGLARGACITWLPGAHFWEPDHLRVAVAAIERAEARAVQVAIRLGARQSDRADNRTGPATPARLAAGFDLDLGSMVIDRSLAVEVGGFDEGLPAVPDYDFAYKVARIAPPLFVSEVGVTTDDDRRARDRGDWPRLQEPRVDHDRVDRWRDVVVSRHCLDWTELARRRTSARAVSVVLTARGDWQPTETMIRRVIATTNESDLTVEVVVVAAGFDAPTSAVIDSLSLQFPRVKIVHAPGNGGTALSRNRALPHVGGRVVVFLDVDVELRPGWLEPLVENLRDDDVLGAQSLELETDGTIHAAGVAFPGGGGLPHTFLRRLPVEDAGHGITVSAPCGSVLAFRYPDVAAVQGFDPLLRNGLEEVDLGLRLARHRPGHFVVCSQSVVLHHIPAAGAVLSPVPLDRLLFLDRWRTDLPGDATALWRRHGFDVVRYEMGDVVGGDRRLATPVPVLTRCRTISVTEGVPSLRWAIKNPAPCNASAEIWGDTHFARRLAASLHRLGQQVVIDHRPAFERPTGMLDDVVLVLRGLAPFRPAAGQVTLGWLISHPELLSRAEAESYDRLLAASLTWSEAKSRCWGIRIDPLLQATDPELFHPDLARPDTGHPVLFVGGSRKQRRRVVLDAVELGLPLSVYGPHWDRLIPDRYVKGAMFPYEQVGAAYRSAGVVLNDHWEDMRVDGFVSNRIFDAVAAGARVITDDVVGLGHLFGRSVQVAHDRAELGRLAGSAELDAIFGDDEERRKVAARIHAAHSFDVRAQQLLDVVLDVRASLSAARRDAMAAGPESR